jgi:hypothetical protein
MRYASYAVGIYAIVNFVLFLFTTQRQSGAAGGGSMPPEVVRGFSGHWLIFYGAAFLIACSYARTATAPAPRCANGHEVDSLAKFCAECGAPAVRIQTDAPSESAPVSPR